MFCTCSLLNHIYGADYWLKSFGKLPEYYITKDMLVGLGWSDGKKPSKFAPGKMYFKGIYDNSDGHLPDKSGRIWFEADINYYEGRRNRHRIGNHVYTVENNGFGDYRIIGKKEIK